MMQNSVIRLAFKYGAIAGIILAVMIFVLMYFFRDPGTASAGGKWIGNIFMISAFSMIYFAIKTMRDKYSGGVINFQTGFRLGLLISIIAAAVYSVTWLFYYHAIDSTYLEQSIIVFEKQLESEGKSREEITDQIKTFSERMDNYRKPGVMAFYTFMEMFPFGLILSVLCAFLMKRKGVEG
jgi:hypothetical protein